MLLSEAMHELYVFNKELHEEYQYDTACDCTELADKIYDYARSLGLEARVITAKGDGIGSTLLCMEYGTVHTYDYHAWAVVGGCVFDPRYSPCYVDAAEYANYLYTLNEGRPIIQEVDKC